MKKTKKVLYGILSTSVASLTLTGCGSTAEIEETAVSEDIENINNTLTEDTEYIDNIDFECDNLIELEDEIFQCQDENSEASGYYYANGSWFPTYAALLGAGYVLGKKYNRDQTYGSSSSGGASSSGTISSNKNNINSNQMNDKPSNNQTSNSSSIQSKPSSNPAQSGMGRNGGSIGG